MARFREDERFKGVGPDAIVLPCPAAPGAPPPSTKAGAEEAEIWFDWAFVDFWKSNYCEHIACERLWRQLKLARQIQFRGPSLQTRRHRLCRLVSL